MRKVLLVSSPSRVGHAVRDMELARRIKGRCGDTAVIQMVGPGAEPIAGTNGHAVCARLSPVPNGTGNGDGGAVRGLLPRAVRADLVHLREVVRAVRRIKPDLVVLDAIYSAVPALKMLGYPVIFMTDLAAVAGIGDTMAPGRGAANAPASARAHGESERESNCVPGSDGWRRRIPEMLRLVARCSSRSVFVGDVKRVADERWRRWIERNMLCTGGLALARRADRRRTAAVRQLYHGRRLVVVTAGGGPDGLHLLRTAAEAFAQIRRRARNLSMKVVCGPGLEPGRVRSVMAEERSPEGLEVCGHLLSLPAYVAAADLVVAQAGLSTLEEIALARVPAIVVPVAGHREQEANATYFGERYGMRVLEPEGVVPELLANSAVRALKGRGFKAVEIDQSEGMEFADKEGVEELLDLIENYL